MTGRPKITSSESQAGVEGENVHINCAAISIPEAKRVVWTYHDSAIDDSKYIDDGEILEVTEPPTYLEWYLPYVMYRDLCL